MVDEPIVPRKRGLIMRRSAREWWSIGPQDQGFRHFVRELFVYRRLIAFLSVQAVLQIHRRARLGAVWLILRPMITVITSVIVVGGLLGISTAPVPMVAFTTASLALWTLFQRGLFHGTRSLTRGRWLSRRVYIPRFMFILVSLAPTSVEFVVVLAGAAGVLLYYSAHGVAFGTVATIWAVLPALTLIVLIVLALSSVSGILNSFASDTAMLVNYGISTCFLLTPVVYPLSFFRADRQWLVLLNPLAVAVELWRHAILGTAAPPAIFIVLAFTIVGLMFAAGVAIFVTCGRWASDQG